MTGRLSGAQAENIEGEENVKVKMKIQKKRLGGGGLDDRWRGAKEVIKESKKESMPELKHVPVFILKSRLLQTTNSYIPAR